MNTYSKGGNGKDTHSRTLSDGPAPQTATAPALDSLDVVSDTAEQIDALHAACERAESTRTALRVFAENLAEAGHSTQERISRLIDRLEAQGDAEKRLGELLTTTNSQVQSLSMDVRETVDQQLKKAAAATRDQNLASERLTALIEESRKVGARTLRQITEEGEQQLSRVNQAWTELKAEISPRDTTSVLSASAIETQAHPGNLEGFAAQWELLANERLTQAMDVKIRLAMQTFEERIQSATQRSLKTLTEEAHRQTQAIREEREQALQALRSAEGEAHAQLSEPPQKVSVMLDELEHATSRGMEVSAQLEAQLTNWDAQSQTATSTLSPSAVAENANTSQAAAGVQNGSTVNGLLTHLERVIGQGEQICARQQGLCETAEATNSRITDSIRTAQATMEEQTRSTIQLARKATEAQQGLKLELHSADQQTRELVSVIQSARQTRGQTTEDVKAAHLAADRLLAATQSAASQGQILESLINTCQSSREHMTRETNLFEEAVTRMEDAIERSVQVSEEFNARNQQIREAIQMADKRSQIQRQERQFDEVSIKELRSQGEATRELLGELDRSRLEATDTISKLQTSSSEALSAVRGVHELLNRVDTKRGDLSELEQVTSDTIERVHLVSETLQQLAQRTNDLHTTLDQSLSEPRQLVASAQAQADQLRNVCQAVKKVSTGLSQTTLQANERIKSFNEASQTAEQRMDRLQRDTTRAAETLKHWVEEAIRAQTRLAATLSETPTIDRTHPLDALRSLSELSTTSSTTTPLDYATATSLETAGKTDTEPKAAHSLQAARNRNKDISRLIEEARQRAESLVP